MDSKPKLCCKDRELINYARLLAGLAPISCKCKPFLKKRDK